MILEVDNIELYFSNKRILNGIYLKAETGKTTAIIGSNGGGKSCLLQIIFGVIKPKYKLIRINNKPFLKPLYQTKLIGFLPQYNYTPNRLKVSSIFNLLNVDWREFISFFDGFSHYKNHTINNLSGGERRIIEVYLLLKGDYKIILLDEPFSHISPLHIEKITQLIETEKHNKAIIITDHMYQHIIETADDIYLLKDGHTKLIDDLKDLEFFKYLSTGSLKH
ncbi:ATP-binding cassette domain-containing protein [Psychroserpens ponticola]|uniref:ABC transporter ATP-binding protein n=1 Tax=Psychroserpens ponticola TaxID=2932268 RepID=A0ABY7RZ90_9FLAO|nr:ABC transporter ATP-binding protein [Psychroserpens ponticola]WCO02471.1 ABC transporter ATP-binding protein [Psychroserpens ponticola]